MHLFLLKTKGLERKQMGRLVGAQWRWQRGEARGLILNKCLEANFWPTPPCLTTEANFWPIQSFQRFLDAGVRTSSPQSEPAFDKGSVLSFIALSLDVQTFEILLGQAVNDISRNRILTIKPEEWGCLQVNSKHQCTVYLSTKLVTFDSVFICQW